MAQPRIFVSSTYYDLKHIRNGLESFIDQFGYEPVLFESGNVAFSHEATLTQSCYEEVEKCHMLVLIVGGRYGSNGDPMAKPPSNAELERIYQQYNSVTKKEYEKARERGIPIYVFVEKGVRSELSTYKQNRENATIKYAHVDNVSVFNLIEEIEAQPRNNLIRDFEKLEDITSWLRDQWAGVFAGLLTAKKEEANLADLASQVAELKELSNTLKEYTQAIGKKLQPKDFGKIIEKQEKLERDSRQVRFAREPMINFLLTKAPKSVGLVRLYDAFQKSNSVDEFLQISKFEPFQIEQIIRNHEGAVREDYLRISRRYKAMSSDAYNKLALNTAEAIRVIKARQEAANERGSE